MQIKKIVLVFLLLVLNFVAGEWSGASNRENYSPMLIEKFKLTSTENSSDLPATDLLQTALYGYELLKNEHTINRQEVITIIDFSLPSNRERLWVLDLMEVKVLYHCLVSQNGRGYSPAWAKNNISHQCIKNRCLPVIFSNYGPH
jgi:hypothetical protein